jgi:integrase
MPLFSEIATFAYWVNKQGFSPATIQTAVKTLRAIARRVNLLDPKTFKSHITMRHVSETRKQKITEDLARFYEYKKIRFAKPHYRRIEVMPPLPSETEIDQLTSGLGKKSATFILLLKETGMRPGECWGLKWIGLDTETCTIRVRPEKGSNPRTLKVSVKLVCMINALPKKWTYIFRNPVVPRENSLHVLMFGVQRKLRKASTNVAVYGSRTAL